MDQTVAGLTQGRELKGTIVFLGGPLHFLAGLRQRFVETLHLDQDHAIFPEDGDCFAAIGAALCTEDSQPRPFEELLDLLEHAATVSTPVDTMDPLFTSQADYEAFSARHQAMAVPTVDLATYTGPAYLGIDAGSTTTKMVLIDPDCNLLYSFYHSNQGNPVSIVLPQLREIYAQCGDRVTIQGAAVTGYGEDLIKNAFSCDLGLVETVAHLNAARHFTPDVDFIIDIGGQDMKCFKIRNGAVDSILLNEACSSGCGSFIETFAKALGYTIADFSKMGLFARHPVNLGSRCTVFMNSSVKQAQKDGASVEDISAGLSISVVKNAIYKVIRAASADDLGQHIVVQGGTFLNDAVLRSFELEIGREVTRPTISGMMGAYGAALAAKDAGLTQSALLSAEALASFTHEARPATCKLCTNHCSLTINRFDGGRKFISGNRCSRPLGQEKVDIPDLLKFKYQYLRSLQGKGEGDGSRGKIGIPFGLNMYENLHIGVLGLPAQHLRGLPAGGDQCGGVAGAAALLPDGDGVAGDPAGGLDDLPVGEALPVAQVEGGGGVGALQVVQGQEVGVDEILHVDVVPDTGAVLGGVVGAEEGELLPLALGHLEDEGDQVALRPVILADGAVVPGSGHVEVAQGAELEAVGQVAPLERRRAAGHAPGPPRDRRARPRG